MSCCDRQSSPPCAGITRFRFRRSADSRTRPLSPVGRAPVVAILARRSCQTARVDVRRQRLQTRAPVPGLRRAARRVPRRGAARRRRHRPAADEGRRATRRSSPPRGGSRPPASATARCSSSTTVPTWSHAAGADGVHVGQDDMPVAEARAIVGADRLIGLSTHTPRADRRRRAASTTSASGRSTRRRPSPAGRPSDSSSSATRPRTPSVPFFAIGGIATANVAAVQGRRRASGSRSCGR